MNNRYYITISLGMLNKSLRINVIFNAANVLHNILNVLFLLNWRNIEK